MTNGVVPLAKVDVNCPVTLRVVNAPVEGVVPPIAPGIAKVAPFRVAAFKFATFVVEETENGAVPVAKVDVI